jgi:hypothetical protein
MKMGLLIHFNDNEDIEIFFNAVHTASKHQQRDLSVFSPDCVFVDTSIHHVTAA